MDDKIMRYFQLIFIMNFTFYDDFPVLKNRKCSNLKSGCLKKKMEKYQNF